MVNGRYCKSSVDESLSALNRPSNKAWIENGENFVSAAFKLFNAPWNPESKSQATVIFLISTLEVM